MTTESLSRGNEITKELKTLREERSSVFRAYEGIKNSTDKVTFGLSGEWLKIDPERLKDYLLSEVAALEAIEDTLTAEFNAL